MEWIIEGVSLIFIGAIVASVTYIDYTSVISKTIFGFLSECLTHFQ